MRILSFLSMGVLLPFTCARTPAQSRQTPAQEPVVQAPSSKQLPKTAIVGPAAPQSTHYPILLLAFGSDPTWNLRIGLKGPERLDRPNYPPITLEPADVIHETAADSWTYHAKDTATGAAVAVHLAREACSGITPPPSATPATSSTPPPPIVATKFTFRVSVDHAEIGTLGGCARIATELFPKINNKPTDDDDDAKPKEPVSTVTNFKSPVAVAYLNSMKQLVLKRGSAARTVAPNGSQPAVSHDGKRLLYTRSEKSPEQSISLYDSGTSKSTEVLAGAAQQAFWSPDDSSIAFLKFEGGKWRIWSMQTGAPEKSVQVYGGDVSTLHGWADAATILADDTNTLFWIGVDGSVKQSFPMKDILGEAFGTSAATTLRLHPLNPDLLLVSAEWIKPPTGAPTDSRLGRGFGFFLYELRSKRRVVLSPLNMLAEYAEWSRDGLQILFTGTDTTKHSATYRIFWDGTGMRRFTEGTELVVGQ